MFDFVKLKEEEGEQEAVGSRRCWNEEGGSGGSILRAFPGYVRDVNEEEERKAKRLRLGVSALLGS